MPAIRSVAETGRDVVLLDQAYQVFLPFQHYVELCEMRLGDAGQIRELTKDDELGADDDVVLFDVLWQWRRRSADHARCSVHRCRRAA